MIYCIPMNKWFNYSKPECIQNYVFDTSIDIRTVTQLNRDTG